MSGWSRVVALAFAILVGSITDRTTGQPLGGVTVAIGAAHAVSRADGSFRLTMPKAGHAVVSVSSDDVPPQQFPVTVGGKAPVRLRVCSTTLDYNCGPPQ
ncbi:MAG: carboxypeptidase regulatory-like domain-containing protein [Candidatus Lustribacter sp.]